MARDLRRMWAIVLAGGEGSRVRSLTTNAVGESAPKQFCSFGTGVSLLRRAIDRAAGIVPPQHIVTVVAPQHRHWWEHELSDLPVENIVVQPQDRGTAAGILLPLNQVLRRDPAAQVLVVPSDHYVENEPCLRSAILDAVLVTDGSDGRVVLLGIMPRTCDTEYGWIVPATAQYASDVPARQVESFVEKPDGERARSLMRRGAVLNSFIFVASGTALLGLFQHAAPHLLERFFDWQADAPTGPLALEALYADLPTCDFSRDILERSCGRLWVVRVPDCGWVDLGTPVRLREFGRPRGSAQAVRETESETPVLMR